MKRVLALALLISVPLQARENKPFVAYPEATRTYLKRIQQGDQATL